MKRFLGASRPQRLPRPLLVAGFWLLVMGLLLPQPAQTAWAQGGGVYRGSNVNRNDNTNPPDPSPPEPSCAEQAKPLRESYEALARAYRKAEAGGNRVFVQIFTEMIHDLRHRWQKLNSDCRDIGDIGPPIGPPQGSSPGSDPGPGSQGTSSGGGGGGSGGGGSGSGGGSTPVPAPPPRRAPKRVYLIVWFPQLAGKPAGARDPKGTAPASVLDQTAWDRLGRAWERMNAAHPSPEYRQIPETGSDPANISSPDLSRFPAAAAREREAEALERYAAAYERYLGAKDAGDQEAMRLQSDAMVRFARTAIDEAVAAAEKQSEFERQMAAQLDDIQAQMAVQGVDWPTVVQAARNKIDADGLPPQLQDELIATKAQPEAIAEFRNQMRTITAEQIQQGIKELKDHTTADAMVRSELASLNSTARWPPPPEIEALEAAQQFALRLRVPAVAVPSPSSATTDEPTTAATAVKSVQTGLPSWLWFLVAGFFGVLLVGGLLWLMRRSARKGK